MVAEKGFNQNAYPALNILKEYQDNYLQLNKKQRQEIVMRSIDVVKEKFIALNAQYFENVNDLYSKLGNKKFLVRREDPFRLLESIFEKNKLKFQLDPDVLGDNTVYANSALWNPRQDGPQGLNNAFVEGFGTVSGLVFVFGVQAEKELKDLEIQKIPDNQKLFFNLQRNKVVCAQGEINPKDIDFVIMRLPHTLVSEDFLTEEEAERIEGGGSTYCSVPNKGKKEKVINIFRGFYFNKK